MSLIANGSDTKCYVCDRVITDTLISNSVGIDGKNINTDVMTVQQLLNAVPAIAGGPTPLLKEDGLCGPKTQSAISAYQQRVLGWSDGRVDPNGRTINSLCQYILNTPTVPYGTIGAYQKGSGVVKDDPKLGADSILVGLMCMRTLEPFIHNLRWKFTRTDAKFIAFIDKHFATGTQKVTTSDIHHLQQVVGAIHHYIARFNAFGKLPIENVVLYNSDPPGDTIAWTVRGGDKMTTRQVQIYMDKKTGKITKNPGQSIWLTSLFANESGYAKHWVMLHELAHFVGARDGSYNKIDDYSYAFEKNFLKIPKFQKLHNAESISLFMLEYCLGTDMIAGLPRIQLVKDHFIKSPKVNAGQIV